MPRKLIIDNLLATKLADTYANTTLTEKAICEKFKISKYYFRKALDRVIILGIIDDDIAAKIAKKADENHNQKLKELNLGSSNKIKIFYDSLFKKRHEYYELSQKYFQLENYFYLLESLECTLDLVKFQENSFDSFVSSDDERNFKNKDSTLLCEEIQNLKLMYSDNLKEFKEIKSKLEEIEKSVF